MKRYSRVYIEVTNICNRSCSFCPGTRREKRRMTREEFAIILDKLRGVTDYVYLHVMGEPLTHPKIGELVSLVSSRGMKCAITTNGTLLPTRGELLVKNGVYKVNISLHSFEDGSEQDYLDYIRGCTDFADMASRAGVLTVFRLWNRGVDKGRNVDTLSLIRGAFTDGEWAEGTRGYRIRNKLHLEWGDRFEWPDMAAIDMGDAVFCHGLGDHFAILVDGTVVPCCLDREGAIPLGNIFESSVGEIISSERAVNMCRGFAEKRATEELCRRCGYARRFKL